MTLFILLAILIGGFGLLTAIGSLTRFGPIATRRRGQISLAMLFLFTGMGHFVQTDQMVQMLPPLVPNRTVLIWASGVFEWVLAAGLLTERYSRPAGICAMAFLVLVFPGNVYAALNRVEMGGHGAGPAYLLVRAPFQMLLIGWAYWCAVRESGRAARADAVGSVR